MLLELFKILFLGIVEGITEWLPISSTGHMILVDEFLKLNVTKEFKDFFLYAIQLGAIFAVVVIYWQRLWPFTAKKEDYHLNVPVCRMWVKVIIAVIPSILIALPLDDWFEAHFYSAFTVSLMLILYGVLYIWLENRNKQLQIKPKVRRIETMSFKTAFLIGCFQALSIIPGTSRSGSTILGGMILGCSRSVAAEFSFFMAIPTMVGASLLKFVKFGFHFTGAEIVYTLFGMAVAFGVSYLCIKLLMNYVKKHDFKVFGYYRVILGAVVLVYFGMKALIGG